MIDDKFYFREFSNKQTGESLRPAVTSLSSQQFNLVAVDVGPGSYTGGRVGVAFAQGFAQALGIPWVGIDVWTILDYIAPTDTTAVTAIRSGEVLIRENGFVIAKPLSEVKRPFGFPNIDPEKYGGVIDPQEQVPDFCEWMSALNELAQKPEAEEQLPQYYDRFSHLGKVR